MQLDDVPIPFGYNVVPPLAQSTGTDDFKCLPEFKNFTTFLTMAANQTICSESKHKQLKLQCIGILNSTRHTLRSEYLAQDQYMKGNKKILAKKKEITSKSPFTLQSLLVCHSSYIYITKGMIISDSPRHFCQMFWMINVWIYQCPVQVSCQNSWKFFNTVVKLGQPKFVQVGLECCLLQNALF